MCFLIAGVQPKTRVLDQTPARCPSCGLFQAQLRRVDHYFSLFFIPLLRVKQGTPFLYCQRCQRPVDDETAAVSPTAGTTRPGAACRSCGRLLEANFNFCPACGERIR